MLPSILEIAKSNNIDTSNIDKNGEVRISCPICGNLDLTINPHKNVYFCSSCKKGGGVKKFSSLFSIKTSVGSSKKKFGAASLSVKQLDKIGWGHLKTSSVDFFRKNHKQVWQDWLAYRNERLEKIFALFVVMMHMPNANNGGKIYNYIIEAIEHSEITNLDIQVFTSAYTGDIKSAWVDNGKAIARKAVLRSRQYGDYANDIAPMLIIFDYHKSTVEINPNEQIQWYSTKKFTGSLYPDFFDWYKYEYNLLVYHFALFVIMQNESDVDVQTKIFEKICLMQRDSTFNHSMFLFIDEYVKDDIFRADWAREGTRLARICWRNAGEYDKSEYLLSVFMHVKYYRQYLKNQNNGGMAI